MKSYSKIIFVFVGLFIIGAGFVWGRDNILPKAPVNGEKFEDWVVSCIKKDDNTPEICFLSQQINLTQDDKTQTIASYQVGYFGNNKVLQIIQVLPLGLNVEAGTTIISAKKLIASGKFKVCLPENCQAIADLKSSDLDNIIKNSDNFVGIINAEGKQINLPISNKGLKEALKKEE